MDNEFAFTTTTEQVASLFAEGLSYAEIAQRAQIDPKRVGTFVQAALKSGLLVNIAPDVRTVLAAAGKKRDIPTYEVIRRLLNAIARDGIVDAVLDDGGVNAEL